MNFWNFAVCHPVAATIIGLGTVASVTGIGIAYARNKTPVVGNFSPSFNLNLGEDNHKAAEEMKLNGADSMSLPEAAHSPEVESGSAQNS